MEHVLVIGSGGREHAIVQACKNSEKVKKVIVAPGNGGMSQSATCVPIDVGATDALLELAEKEAISFVIVGPEIPLALGLADAFRAKGIPVYGPSKDGAEFEASKVRTKAFLEKYKIPTAGSATFRDYEAASKYVHTKPEASVVIKASGLAAGKGVIIPQSYDEADVALREMLLDGKFGESGKTVLIEDFLCGEEASITVMVCRDRYIILPSSQDHKRIGEGDTGLNTGGMGAYAPADCITPDIHELIESTIVRPSVHGIVSEGIDYRGTLYIGVMLTEEGPKVLEYNVRFGDPETQVLLPMLKSDPIELMFACATDSLEPKAVEMHSGYACVVVQAADGYPEAYPKGEVITTPEHNDDETWIYYAGTSLDNNGQIVSDGGRVLGIVGRGTTLSEAVSRAYGMCAKISFQSCYYRKDIAHRQLNRSRT